MNKHTPGPWTAREPNGPGMGWRVGPAWLGEAPWSDETRVDAHLIAAAPDLLALCEELLPELACHCDEGFTSRGRHEPNALCHYHDDLRAAVAKARGEKT